MSAFLFHVSCGKEVRARRVSTSICSLEVGRRVFGGWLILGATGGDVRDGLSKAASALPGMGPSDVYFPNSFAGEWKVVKNVTDVKIMSARELKELQDVQELKLFQDLVGKTVEYPVQFISHRGNVIASRGFNIRSSKAADALAVGRTPGRMSSLWDPDNPNVLTVSERGSPTLREIKVTKRSFNAAPGGEGTFEYTEYARIVDTVDGEQSDPTQRVEMPNKPKLLAKRTLAKFKIISPEQIDSLQLEYYFPYNDPTAPAE
eukprot:CAMPEP_0184745860 /NCGR_PEP_ID=MMETSP0315-20130426/8525_1 /TAXON_ID=101924 /ORGANISM="Rhodosorus marinus, Strain UTEX LB 2760" /LENGTH=260 /DNA_ID=CAMNT_0027218231 /DNA_START=25 /DNA_END=804 /DNA_ORIENTATION=+